MKCVSTEYDMCNYSKRYEKDYAFFVSLEFDMIRVTNEYNMSYYQMCYFRIRFDI